MNRIAQLDPDRATGKTKQLFELVQTEVEAVPNLFRVLGVSPAALEGYLNLAEALAEGGLTSKIREQIALVVAECNMCSYGLSEHTFIGFKVGLTEKDIADARHAKAAIRKTDAMLKLVRSIVVQRGEVSDADLDAARSSGMSDAEIIETVANVVLNIFGNYVTHIARTVVDFPEVLPGNGHDKTS
jgi:uncharacterized peroxidase-related enzyme